jgi:hypothetical protein
MPKYTLFFLLLLPLSSFAQFTISGRVVDFKDKKPVANADVFLNNSTSGTNTGKNGEFKMSVRPGKYFIIVSIIGYTDYSAQVQVINGNVTLGDIEIAPSNKTLKEVVVKPNEIPSSYLYNFKEQFLGSSDIAHDCKILNPEILDISYNRNDSTYSASSGDYLIIENPDLGYRIKFKLQDFYCTTNIDSPVIRYNGFVHFEEMDGKSSDIRRWKARRYDVYKNSAMHFFRALVSNRIDDEGFKVQQYITYWNFKRAPDSVIVKKLDSLKKKLKGDGDDMEIRNQVKYWEREWKQPKIIKELRTYPMEQSDLLRVTDKPNVFAFGCDFDKLFVTYNEEKHFDDDIKLTHLNNPKNTECTLIAFDKAFALLDRYGSRLDPYDINFFGVWSKMRVADLLPVDYLSPQEEDANANNPVAVEKVDSTVSNKITTAIADYNTNHITEKAYLHFDRSYYAAGDTIFFKAYVTTGDNHQPSTLSSVLHVDLIDGKGSLNKSISLGIAGGVAWGSLVLPDTLAGGNYQVRAYTEWMRNDGSKAFFDKIVPVAAVAGVKSGIKVNAPSQAMAGKPDVQFFPEGGGWIPGVKTKMAFKAISPNGFGIDAKGTVIDDAGKTVGFFISAHNGMGSFYITGEAGRTYKANITYPDFIQAVVNLPPFSDKGIAMTLNNDSPDKIAVTINATPQYLQANKGKYYTLIYYSNGKANSQVLKLDDATIPTDIYKRELRSGIVRITLFAPGGEPLAERLVFVQNFDELKLKISPDKTAYTTKDKVNLTLNALDEDSAPVSGHFSVSVTDENKLPEAVNNEHTILTDLLLTSELKGYVEQPNYYFDNPTPDVLNNLDILMLTQGYRGFEWRQVFDDKKALVNYPVENGLSLSGMLKTMTGKPVAGGTVTLLSTRHALAKDTTTDNNGNFKFTNLFLTDTARLVLHGHMKNNSDKVKIEITKDIPVATKLSNPDTSMIPITPEVAAAMKKRYEQSGNMKSGIMLKQVNIKRNVNHPSTPELTNSQNLNGAGNADQVIMGSQLVGCPNVRDCLMSLMHGVQYNAGVFYSIRTHVELLGGSRQPMVFIIDGVVTNQTLMGKPPEDMLDMLSPNDIYSIEILVSQSYLSIYGADASGGAIVITTKRGNESTVVNADGSIYYTFHGFEKTRNFYSPKYDVTTPPNPHPDQRTTIYWQPELITDGAGNGSFEFFNSTDPGTYRVVVEGMDTKGNIGRHVYHYTVK